MKKQCQKTTIEIERQEDFYQTYTRIDQNDNFYSKLKLTHQKQANSDLLSVNASLYKGLLTKGLLASCLVEMQSDLTADQITSLKLIGLTDKNCEPELFRKSSVRSVHDSSFSNLREVVIESAYPQNMPADLQTTSTLPSKSSKISFKSTPLGIPEILALGATIGKSAFFRIPRIMLLSGILIPIVSFPEEI